MHEVWVYILIVVLGIVLSLALCGYALRKLRAAPGGKYYMLGTLSAALFNLGYLFELASSDLEQMKMWVRIEYVPLVLIPVFTLLMCCEYVGIRLNLRARLILYFVPCTTLLMQWTNDAHHWYYRSASIRADGPFPILRLEHGPYFYVHTIFLYGCVLASIIVLLLQARTVGERFRMQIWTMAFGLAAPVVASLFYVAGTTPYGIDLGPVCISVSYVFHSIALFRYQMFDVAPIAKDIVFESMSEGVVVLSESDVVVDFNASAARAIPALGASAVGRPFEDVLAGFPALQGLVRRASSADFEYRPDETEVHYRVHYSPVRNKNGAKVGKMITLIDITERVRMAERLQRLASTDGLTQLRNRATYFADSEKRLRELAAGGRGASVVMFDIDFFKKVNDTYGHGAGDAALASVAGAVREELRETDIAGRYGGDEFLIFMPDTPAGEAAERAERIRRRIESLEIAAAGERIRVTSSFGVAYAAPGPAADGDALDRLMRDADVALYAAKKLGRNRVHLEE